MTKQCEPPIQTIRPVNVQLKGVTIGLTGCNSARWLMEPGMGISKQERDYFCYLAEVLESHRGSCNQHHLEMLPILDRACRLLRGGTDPGWIVLKGDDFRTGKFTLRVGDPDEPIQLYVWRYPLTLHPPHTRHPRKISHRKPQTKFQLEIGFGGHLFCWRGRKLRNRMQKDYLPALFVVNEILSNGGLFSAGPISSGILSGQ